MGFPDDSVVKNPRAMQETEVQSLDREDPLQKEKATFSCSFPGNLFPGSFLAWEITLTEEPGGLQSMRSQKSLTQLSD